MNSLNIECPPNRVLIGYCSLKPDHFTASLTAWFTMEGSYKIKTSYPASYS